MRVVVSEHEHAWQTMLQRCCLPCAGWLISFVLGAAMSAGGKGATGQKQAPFGHTFAANASVTAAALPPLIG